MCCVQLWLSIVYVLSTAMYCLPSVRELGHDKRYVTSHDPRWRKGYYRRRYFSKMDPVDLARHYSATFVFSPQKENMLYRKGKLGQKMRR